MSGTIETKKDFTAEVQVATAESLVVLQERGLEAAIEQLMEVEKKCRLHNDFHNLKEVCLHMVKLCKQQSDWSKLNSVLAVISKRRAQSKHAISVVVGEAMTYIDSTPNLEAKIELIKTLKDICDGKIYVEGESAKLHLMLALIYEEANDLENACEMIQDVHVETYGSLSKFEKAEYILQQIRLNLKKKDFVRALIQSRKMNRKTIEEAGFETVKVSFYRMMIEYHTNEKNTWEICQCYFKIYDTSASKADASLVTAALESCVIFLLLSKFDNHTSDMMHRLKLVKEVQAAPELLSLLTTFTTHEIIALQFAGRAEIEAHPTLKLGSLDSSEQFIAYLQDRVVQHNLRVVAKCYTHIRLARLSELLGLCAATLEESLSEMSSSGDLYVKIDRPAGVICFQKQSSPDAILSDWSSDIAKLLNLMESTSHLINRENMVHNVN